MQEVVFLRRMISVFLLLSLRGYLLVVGKCEWEL